MANTSLSPDISSLTGSGTKTNSRAGSLANLAALQKQADERRAANTSLTSRATTVTMPQKVEIDPDIPIQEFNQLYSSAMRDLDRNLSAARGTYLSAKNELAKAYDTIKDDTAWATDPSVFTKPFEDSYNKVNAALEDTANISAKRALLDLEAYERNNPDQRPGASFSVRRDVTASIIGEVSRAKALVATEHAKNISTAMQAAGQNQLALSGILAQGATALASLASDYINVRSSVAATAFSVSVGAAETLANLTAGILEANQRTALSLEAQQHEVALAGMQTGLEREKLSVQERIAEIQALAANPFEELSAIQSFDQLNPTALPSLGGRQSIIFDPLAGSTFSTYTGGF